MKSLYESLLGNVKGGISDQGVDWLRDQVKNNPDAITITIPKQPYGYTSKPIAPDMINNVNGKIKFTSAIKRISLNFNNNVNKKPCLEEFPGYVVLADDSSLSLRVIGDVQDLSFVPHKLRDLTINNNVWGGKVSENCNVELIDYLILKSKHVNNITIKFTQDGKGHVRFDADKYSNVKIVGAKIADMVNDFNLGDKFSKAIARKAEMNKYKNKYEFPVTDAALDVINKFWKENNIDLDLKTLEEIRYTQNSKLVKHEGNWYRCKNW